MGRIKKRSDQELTEDSPLDEASATWRVVDRGHKWVTVDGTRVLTHEVELGDTATMYHPMDNHSLVMQFIRLDPSETTFQEFANQFGLLGTASVDLSKFRPSDLCPVVLGHWPGEPWEEWVKAHRGLGHAVRLAEQIRAGDVSECLTSKTSAPSPKLSEKISWKFQDRGAIRVMDLSERDATQAARRFVQKWVNDGLDGHSVVRSLWHEGRKEFLLRALPKTLLGCMWWQVAGMAFGEVKYQYCKVCRTPLQIGGDRGFRKNREFCSPACQQKDHRNRVRQAKDMHARGKSPTEIAKALHADADAVKRWLDKAK